MRVLLQRIALTSLVAVATGAAYAEVPQKPMATEASCPRSTTYLADKGGIYRNQPLAPRKLSELPPATAYMAVYRRIDRCEVPMTMSEYRTHRR